MAQLRRTFTGLTPDHVRGNLDRVRQRMADAGADPGSIEVCAAIKYVAPEELPVLAEAGVELVGENRAQDLTAKHALHADLFTWDFIGGLQSRKVKDVAPLVRLIHSVASDSVLAKLESTSVPEVLIQVNVAAEEGKGGIAPDQLGDVIERCPVPVTGLATMPPFAEEAEQNRPHFARLAQLAGEHGLARLSMGTTQDYWVAAQEGATIVRIGTALYD